MATTEWAPEIAVAVEIGTKKISFYFTTIQSGLNLSHNKRKMSKESILQLKRRNKTSEEEITL